MADEKTNEEISKNPNEDSMVTSNHLAGKKVDANLDNPGERPEESSDQITQQSQKGKKVDADPEQESDKPSQE